MPLASRTMFLANHFLCWEVWQHEGFLRALQPRSCWFKCSSRKPCSAEGWHFHECLICKTTSSVKMKNFEKSQMERAHREAKGCPWLLKSCFFWRRLFSTWLYLSQERYDIFKVVWYAWKKHVFSRVFLIIYFFWKKKHCYQVTRAYEQWFCCLLGWGTGRKPTGMKGKVQSRL